MTLQPGASNRLTYVKGQPFTVAFTNQGENDEFNVKVTLDPAPGRQRRSRSTRPCRRSPRARRRPSSSRSTASPPIGAAVTIEVEVAKVPGEKKTDNNKSSYPTLFARGLASPRHVGVL